jgi:hypothetical protein
MDARMDPERVETFFHEIADKIAAIDGEIRSTLAGAAARRVKPVAQRRFAEIGLALSDADLDAYASSVARRATFDFVLK